MGGESPKAQEYPAANAACFSQRVEDNAFHPKKANALRPTRVPPHARKNRKNFA